MGLLLFLFLGAVLLGYAFLNDCENLGAGLIGSFLGAVLGFSAWFIIGGIITTCSDTYVYDEKTTTIDSAYVCNDTYNRDIKYWNNDSNTGGEIHYGDCKVSYHKSEENVIIEQKERFENKTVAFFWDSLTVTKYEVRSNTFPTMESGN